MTLRWIPMDALEPHPENANRMPPRLLEKLKGHLERTGRYEPLVVRPAGGDGGRYQILNGHHRARALRELGHERVRCDVWAVDDAEARLLLATLNRLEGRDDPTARAALVARLAEDGRRSAEDLAHLLPEPPDAVARLLRLASPPPAPADPAALDLPARPMTFFLSEEQYAVVTEALGEAGKSEDERVDRAEAIERLATWYLEARNLR